MFHDCSTGLGSSGSPIISRLNNKVIGIYKGADIKKKMNIGNLINTGVKEYINILLLNNSINSSFTEKLILLYESPNNNNEDSINNSVDSYEKIFGIKIENEPINGIKLSNILSENLLDTSSDLNPLVNTNQNNFINIEEIDNFYEGKFDIETKVINLKTVNKK